MHEGTLQKVVSTTPLKQTLITERSAEIQDGFLCRLFEPTLTSLSLLYFKQSQYFCVLFVGA